jgi:hypothetical protein
MNVLGIGGTQTWEQCSPWRPVCSLPPRHRVNVVAGCVDSVMFFVVCDFAALHRAALCAARVAISAAVSSTDGDIWGVSDPLCHPPIPVPRLSPRGVAHAPDACHCRPANRALSLTSPSAPPVSRAMAALVPSSMHTSDRFLTGKCALMVERAPALNQRQRRSPTVTSCRLSSPRVSFVL